MHRAVLHFTPDLCVLLLSWCPYSWALPHAPWCLNPKPQHWYFTPDLLVFTPELVLPTPEGKGTPLPPTKQRHLRGIWPSSVLLLLRQMVFVFFFFCGSSIVFFFPFLQSVFSSSFHYQRCGCFPLSTPCRKSRRYKRESGDSKSKENAKSSSVGQEKDIEVV